LLLSRDTTSVRLTPEEQRGEAGQDIPDPLGGSGTSHPAVTDWLTIGALELIGRHEAGEVVSEAQLSVARAALRRVAR
jgi:hypothetical protein